jgi:hypothetical protein
MEWRKMRGFFFGSLLGGLLGALLAPRRRRRLALDPSLRHLEETHAFSSAPCYRPDDTFT